MTQKEYEKLTLAEAKKLKFITLRPLQNRICTIPVGSICTVDGKINGFSIETIPCSCCKVKVRMTRVTAGYLDVYQEPEPPEHAAAHRAAWMPPPGDPAKYKAPCKPVALGAGLSLERYQQNPPLALNHQPVSDEQAKAFVEKFETEFPNTLPPHDLLTAGAETGRWKSNPDITNVTEGVPLEHRLTLTDRNVIDIWVGGKGGTRDGEPSYRIKVLERTSTGVLFRLAGRVKPENVYPRIWFWDWKTTSKKVFEVRNHLGYLLRRDGLEDVHSKPVVTPHIRRRLKKEYL